MKTYPEITVPTEDLDGDRTIRIAPTKKQER